MAMNHQRQMLAGPCRVSRLSTFTRFSSYSVKTRGYPDFSFPRFLQHDSHGTSSNLSKHNVQIQTTLKIHDIDAPHTGVIKVLSLNLPKSRNALSRQLLQELGAQIESIHAEGSQGSTRVLVLASESDHAFCAGADLKERRGMSEEETSMFLATLRHTFKRLAELPIPTIAAVSSVALGGGLELALCTDIRVFSSNVTVGLPEVRLAILPGAGGTYRLPAVIGACRARDMILTGRRIDGYVAYDWGLCNYLVEVQKGSDSATQEEKTQMLTEARENVLKESIRTAKSVCEGGPLAIRAAVQALRGLSEEAENAAYDTILPTKDRLEALQAFGSKPSRAPVFKGH